MKLLQTSRVIKFDYDGEKPVRGEDGLCVEGTLFLKSNQEGFGEELRKYLG